MRKRSNPTDRTSYLQFCDLLAVFCARLTEYRYPDRPGIGFGTHCRIGRVATECDRSPGEPKATPAPGIGENVGGELGRSPHTFGRRPCQGAAGDAERAQARGGQGGVADAQGAEGDRSASVASAKEPQVTRSEPQPNGGQGRRISLFVYPSIIKCFLVDFSVSSLSSD